MRISDWSSDVCSSDLHDDISPSVREVGPYSGADVEIRTVALVRNALLRVQFDTAEIFPELAIDHASQGIRSINGRSTARDNLCAGNQIGSAPCRERECQNVSITVVADSLNKKKKRTTITYHKT